MGKRILIAEDEKAIREFVVINLQRAGYETVEAGSGDEALALYNRDGGRFDVAVLDIMMPGQLSGLDVCKELRRKSGNIGIIMLSARAQEMDKVSGLMMGADDYVTKPFSPSELVARVKGHIQRYQRLVGGREKPRPEILKIRGLEIDRDARRVWVNGREKNMTSKEYDLLLFLAEHPDTVFSKDRLFDSVWGMDAYGDVSTVTVHIKHIRDKIEIDPEHIQYIETVWGVGYRFRG